MKILSIDPGTAKMGMALWDTDYSCVLDNHTFIAEGDTWQKRLYELWNKLCYIFGRTSDVDICVIEEPASKQNYTTTLALGACVGMLMAEAWHFFGCPVELVPSSHVKRWCRIRPGTRRAQIKAWTRNVVRARLSEIGQWRDEYSEDEVDALALCLCYADKVRNEEFETELKGEVT